MRFSLCFGACRSLQDNSLTSIPAGLLSAQTQLQTLMLGNNLLTTVSSFAALTSLQTLSLVDNNIASVDPVIFSQVYESTGDVLLVEMSGNPSVCKVGWLGSAQQPLVYCSCAAGTVGVSAPGQTVASGCQPLQALGIVDLPTALLTGENLTLPISQLNASLCSGTGACCTASSNSQNITVTISAQAGGEFCTIAPGYSPQVLEPINIVLRSFGEYSSSATQLSPKAISLDSPTIISATLTQDYGSVVDIVPAPFVANPGFSATISFTLTSSLPAGLIFNSSTGLLSGTPAGPQPPTLVTVLQQTTLSEYTTVSNVVTQLTLDIVTCSDALTCHGGQCEFESSPYEGGFTCRCPQGLTGKFCELSDPFVANDVFVGLHLALLVIVLVFFCALLYGFVQRNVAWLAAWDDRLLGGWYVSKALRKANSSLLQRLVETEEEMVTMRRVWQIDEGELKMEREIAKGAFGVVWKAVWNEITVAVKTLDRPVHALEKEDAEEFDREVSFMRNVRHPNIVLFFGAGATRDGLPFLVTEFMERGSLWTVLESSPDIAWTQKLAFAHDTALGMQHLHSLGSIHRDLKSGNLLVTKGFRIKVADFGTARLAKAVGVGGAAVEQSNPLLTTLVGTALWMAPEVLFKQPYSQKADVYSYGIVLFEILTQTVPWNELPSKFMVNHVDAALREGKRPAITGSHFCGPGFRELMERCWAQDPAARPTFDEVVTDELFQAQM